MRIIIQTQCSNYYFNLEDMENFLTFCLLRKTVISVDVATLIILERTEL